MLIVFGGLPGAGKSPIARLAAIRLRAVCPGIETIEHALREARVGRIRLSVSPA
jgi:predicted kinase